MPSPGKTKIRRQRVRRQRAESSASWWERFRAAVGLWPAAAFVLFAVLASVIALYGKHSAGFSVGEKIDQPIIARVDVEWVDEVRTEQDRQAARAAAPTHYVLNQKLIDGIARAVQTLYEDAKGAEAYEAFAELAKEQGWTPTEPLFADLHQFTMDEQQSQRCAEWVERLRGLLREFYTYRPEDSRSRRPLATGPKVVLVSTDPQQGEGGQTKQTELETYRLHPISNTDLVKSKARLLAEDAGFPMPNLRPAIRGMLEQRLAAEPLLVYDPALTEQAVQAAVAEVKPAVISFKRGQPIVSPPQGSEDLVLTAEHRARLDAEEAQYRSLLASNDPAAAPLREQLYLERAGVAAIVVVLSAGLFLHVGLYQRRILQVRTRTLALATLVLGVLVLSRLIVLRLQYEELCVAPALVMAACVTIAYPRRFAVGLTAIAALLVAHTIRGDMGVFVGLLIGVAMTAYLLNDIHTRTQIISAGVFTGVGVFIVTFAFGLIDNQAPEYAAWLASLAGGSAVAAALIVQGVLPFIERAFGIATSLTLLEWSSADKPMLQRLAREAPGTYNHSLVMGTLAQAACEAIGANGLLVRVGALYHDIGKIHKSDYFAENQEASISRHDKLAASMSLLIILGHVKDGVELAREYGLPRMLHQFIAEHHGTTVVRYFHHKASEEQPRKAVGKHDREVAEAEFRYPGPKPHSRESAVLMLCDGVEGAVRALSEPTAGRIESVVHQVVMERLNDGQFGECDITLKELQTVEDSLVKSLCTFYHGRVAYPKAAAPKGETRRDEEEEPPEQRRPASLPA